MQSDRIETRWTIPRARARARRLLLSSPTTRRVNRRQVRERFAKIASVLTARSKLKTCIVAIQGTCRSYPSFPSLPFNLSPFSPFGDFLSYRSMPIPTVPPPPPPQDRFISVMNPDSRGRDQGLWLLYYHKSMIIDKIDLIENYFSSLFFFPFFLLK